MPGHPKHIEDLIKHGVNFTEESLKFTVKAPSALTTQAGVVFLEEGDLNSGWAHIGKHFDDFKKYGLTQDKLLLILMERLQREPDDVTHSLKKNRVRQCAVYVVSSSKGNFNLNVAIGQNGYIVTAHPNEMTMAAYYEALKDSAKIGDTMTKNAAYVGLAGYSSSQ